MDDEKDRHWGVISEDNERRHVDSDDLYNLFTDASSWLSFLRLLVTREPALMTMHLDDGNFCRMKVVHRADMGSRATFDDPRGGTP